MSLKYSEGTFTLWGYFHYILFLKASRIFSQPPVPTTASLSVIFQVPSDKVQLCVALRAHSACCHRASALLSAVCEEAEVMAYQFCSILFIIKQKIHHFKTVVSCCSTVFPGTFSFTSYSAFKSNSCHLLSFYSVPVMVPRALL